jgi:hypothetical protein
VALGADAALWQTTRAGDATITVDETHAARGTHALHIKTVTGGSANRAYIKETRTFPATNNVLYGRMFVWFEDALTTDGHFTLAEGAAPARLVSFASAGSSRRSASGPTSAARATGRTATGPS